VLTTERSGNMKDLKQTIFETVSTLRNLFVKMKNNCEMKSKISEVKAEVAKAKTELQRFTDNAVKVQEAPSVTVIQGPVGPWGDKLRNPRIVIINIPEEISIGNVEDILLAHNTDVNLKQGNIKAKFSYETRKHNRNL
jgi:hypothetical protein